MMTTPVKPWSEQGCPICRAEWLSGSMPSLQHVGTSNELHVRLYLCKVCGAHWEELERYAHEVSATAALELQQHGSFAPA
jgi:hypothetical protein